ncbi:hypothetical protein [Megasphaera cerevisiae]|uniref:hypothetical protein n=1 Tax=Megasphaera cerevisiae TaxID=39029 RepID=UPI00099AA886|nr:hypothetical protein [Megasphaera cerevisiae]SJZ57035.1 adhesin HecA family 20-residue repeat-containing protein [Megasphaera cerevisiae DSM 20462]
MNVHAQTIQNDQTLASGGNASLHAEHGLVNTGVVGAGISRDGKADKTGSLTIQAQSVQNDKAQLVAGGDAVIHADTISAKAGEISSQKNAALVVAKTIDMEKGKITARQNLSITADALPLTGLLASGGSTTVTTTDALDNTASADGFGSIQAGGNVTLHTDGILTNVKQIEGGQTVSLDAQTSIVNADTGTINGNTVTLHSHDVDNMGLITASGTTDITANHVKNHETGRIYGDDVTIEASSIENRKNTAREEQLEQEMKVLTEKETALEAAYAVDVTGFTSDEQVQQYKDHIAAAAKDYDTQLAVVRAVQTEMGTHTSAAIAARHDLTMTGDTLLNSAGALLYSGNAMTLTAKGTIRNRGAKIESLGDLALKAAAVYNENDAFSAKRVGSDWVTNPDKIRIDQAGHSEQGQAFDKDEFSNLTSGYGAYHHAGAMEIYEPAYDIVEKPEPGEQPDPAHPEGAKIANYEWNDPIFTALGVTAMTTARPTAAGQEQTAWDTQFSSKLDELNTKITAHNTEAEAHNASLGAIGSQKIDNYTIIRSQSQTSEDKVQTTNAGVIYPRVYLHAGSDMTLDAKGSLVSANHLVVDTKKAVQNTGILQG